jgi:hypothetical protein
MPPVKDLTGHQYGRLTVIHLTEEKQRRSTVWQCRCSCGEYTKVSSSDLRWAGTKSCGCLKREAAVVNANKAWRACVKHGLSNTKGYIRARQSRRNAAKLQRTPAWSDPQAVRDFYQNCPSDYHVDHIVPLRGTSVSGLHVLENLQYLPAKENQQKGNKFNSYGG